ncbi:SRPBCC family protein [Saccharopolyspora sp. NPDC050389]|uniref:SRPBCC family protein n=1 Tax=Saccharopolyspora sp. NPDC050389 TaxID=3155516 RepID=UPI0033CC3B37
MSEPTSYDLHASTHVSATPDEVYRVASDITRMGEWSPECIGGEWASGEPGTAGATFKGHNRHRDDVWTTECEVTAAEPGRRFAWAVLSYQPTPDNSLWSFEIEPDGDGCTLTQRFQMKQPPSRLVSIKESLPAERGATFYEFRRTRLQQAMQQTVDAIRDAAER